MKKKNTIIDYKVLTFAEQKALTPEQLPAEVVSTWKDWKTTFDESTPAKKAESSAKLRAHFAACEKTGLDRQAVALILFKVKF